MAITYITSNFGKFTSMRRELDRLDVALEQRELDLPEIQSDNLRSITAHKLSYAQQMVVPPAKPPLLVQDSGFYLDAWTGFPGPYVKHALKTLGNSGILALVTRKRRGCEFRECLAYADEQGEIRYFEAIIRGHLAFTERGKSKPDAWSQLHKIFIPLGSELTFAEMSDAEQREWRRNKETSTTKFVQWLKEPALA